MMRFLMMLFLLDYCGVIFVLWLQVNGNLVSPLHVLANAEVVEIIVYNVSPYYMLNFLNLYILKCFLCNS